MWLDIYFLKNPLKIAISSNITEQHRELEKIDYYRKLNALLG
jgi:hypothetical protein